MQGEIPDRIHAPAAAWVIRFDCRSRVIQVQEQAVGRGRQHVAMPKKSVLINSEDDFRRRWNRRLSATTRRARLCGHQTGRGSWRNLRQSIENARLDIGRSDCCRRNFAVARAETK